jgi:hypothetical protein
MELEKIENAETEELISRKDELWDEIKKKLNGETSTLAEICEIEYELTKRELVGEDPRKEWNDVEYSI